MSGCLRPTCASDLQLVLQVESRSQAEHFIRVTDIATLLLVFLVHPPHNKFTSLSRFRCEYQGYRKRPAKPIHRVNPSWALRTDHRKNR